MSTWSSSWPLSNKARLECAPPPPDATTTTNTTTTDDPVLGNQRTAEERVKKLSIAITLYNERMCHLLRDAHGKGLVEEKPTNSAAATSPDQGEVVDRLKAEIKQLKDALDVAWADLAAAQWQLREAGRVQTQAPSTFEATMMEVIEAVNYKWQDYNCPSSVTDPAKVIEGLRGRNRELEKDNKNLDRKGFMPKRMHDLVNKVKALMERNSELTEKLEQNERAKADVDKIAELERESIFHLCKELKENQGHKGDLSEYKMNDMVFNMFEDFIKQKMAQYK
ncbi:hypothetical protein PspLS_10530 [Pyricularia sp. CBS 133598]|nr:hypothetical protein PspLS_10530 [Pyricularia sp. CBS 133598]